MRNLEELKQDFFTDRNELIEELEINDYEVLDAAEESIIVGYEDEDGYEFEVDLTIIEAGSTLKIQ